MLAKLSMSKKLALFDFQWQAEAVSLELQKENIHHEINSVAREYKTVLLGGGDNATEIRVAELDYERSLKAMNRFLSSAMSNAAPNSVDRDEEVSGEKNYLKRVVIFSFLGMFMLPIVFNLVATLNYRQLVLQKNSSKRKLIGLCFLILGWILSLSLLFVLVRTGRSI